MIVIPIPTTRAGWSPARFVSRSARLVTRVTAGRAPHWVTIGTVTNSNPAAQRRFTRLQVPGKVVALDDDGNELGQISEVSGGGAQLTLSSAISAGQFVSGTRVHLSIVENGNITDQLWVEVRYVDGNKVGLKFLGHK